MRKFEWLLNWSVREDVRLPNSPISVYKMGRQIGKCMISTKGNQIIGEFDLNEDLISTDYVLYSIGFNSLNNFELVGITLVEPEEGIENRAKQAADM